MAYNFAKLVAHRQLTAETKQKTGHNISTECKRAQCKEQ